MLNIDFIIAVFVQDEQASSRMPRPVSPISCSLPPALKLAWAAALGDGEAQRVEEPLEDAGATSERRYVALEHAGQPHKVARAETGEHLGQLRRIGYEARQTLDEGDGLACAQVVCNRQEEGHNDAVSKALESRTWPRLWVV